MSYCRFSNESDVHAYQSSPGLFVVHVAASVAPELPAGAADLMSAAEMLDFIRQNARPAGGRCDGQVFAEETAQGLFERMRDLATLGYRVPACAWESLHHDYPALGLGALSAVPAPAPRPGM